MMKKVALTMGDPGGVGPEVIVKALSSRSLRKNIHPVIVGSSAVIRDALRVARLPVNVVPFAGFSDARPTYDTVEVLDVRAPMKTPKCRPSRYAGRAAVACIKKAVQLAERGVVHAVVTAPVSKESFHMAGCPWPGHTELLAELTGAKHVAMMFVSRRLKVILCTIHVQLRRVPGMITPQRVYRIIELAYRASGMLGIRNPDIAVAGLNPHAGESGILGGEENRSIMPAVLKARRKGMEIAGPYPPDVVFHRAYRGDFDLVVCMYHDQGLIPFKMVAFETGVNVTVGLPILRTSPDHGTAFDIAWSNRADPTSMIEAIKLAARLRKVT